MRRGSGRPSGAVDTGGADADGTLGASSSGSGGQIYVAAGVAQWGTTAAFEAYDPPTDCWEKLPPLPEAVHHLAAAARQWYVIGGGARAGAMTFISLTDLVEVFPSRA